MPEVDGQGLYTVAVQESNRANVEVDNTSGVALGPISLSFATELNDRQGLDASSSGRGDDDTAGVQPPSIHSMTTDEWRALYEKDGTNDLWLEDEFNAGSRLIGGRAVHKGGVYGFRTGEGPTAGDVPRHKVKIFDHYGNQEIDIEVPEDRYILWEAEDNGLQLPYACRMGCCTACAVRVKEGRVYQPEALGISQELKDQGYALMCVGFPTSDAVMETVSEDEIYDLQFGQYFAAQALDPDAESVSRDDYALSIANMDE
ncbi:Apoferredoxin [Volvox carteri f. nagariensis]|uniref:Ferredoxin n=1 Tax=Volvox carteri f. nagariensis TaxID=3068 RepID=D8TJW2_VOLCA|nr:Apoferredoxin [Volvox carteri f. nagariensis]EFJ52141.1 Apoferredoxin [Volvox carteri f. nagariensis]|eukprot:XP_002946915.1 Apoferredoxin [Volvox carteri f. nagariensis]